MATMEEVFDGAPAPEAGSEAATEQVIQQVEEGAGSPAPDAETTSAETNTEKHVPLAALEAERRGRQDWKERATRAEERARMLEEQQARTQQPQGEQAPPDPVQQLREQMLSQRFDMSEMVARSKYTDLDDVLNVFQEERAKNPALEMALIRHQNPYEYAYREGKRLMLLKEVGDDPAAYRAKVEAEIRASLQPAAAAPAAPHVPASLAGARSSASRTAPAFTGPTPFESIFKH